MRQLIEIINGAGRDTAALAERKAGGIPPQVEEIARAIIADVRARGDEALREYAKKFDGAALSSLRVGQDQIEAAKSEAGDDFIGIMEAAAANIREFHGHQLRAGFEFTRPSGALLGQRILPIRRAGIYVPGGTAAYPSTVLMNAIPAQVAGVEEIVMVTPPGRNGRGDAGILAAAAVAGVTEIYLSGGAQAIAALAYGTESIARVDKICGPGNMYVAAAKRLVFGDVGVDMIAGPSDILVLADSSADPRFVAADLLSQAEHDALASAVLVTTSPALAQAVQQELGRQLAALSRRDIVELSLANRGRIIVAENMEQAVALANAIAPEHLEICTEQPLAVLPQIKNAGSVFLGHYTPEALGDYFAGPNHTLPTEGTVRFSSPLSVDDFTRRSSYICYPPEALAEAAGPVAAFARREGLEAHAASVEIRNEE